MFLLSLPIRKLIRYFFYYKLSQLEQASFQYEDLEFYQGAWALFDPKG